MTKMMMMTKKNTGLRANPLNGFQLRFAGQKTMRQLQGHNLTVSMCS